MKAYLREWEDLSIKSKVKFQWDWAKELEKIISEVEKIVEKKIIPNYQVGYTGYGDYIVKIKINDRKLLIDKLITCSFNYKKLDVKFWYINPEFIVTEKWQKTKKYNLWKFTISDTTKILDVFITKLLEIIEEF